MGTRSEIQDYVKRPGRYSNIDGTGEMLVGVMYLGLALLSYLESALPKHSIWTKVFMEVVLLAVCGLGWWGAKAVKRHITYPRTGYVALKPRRTLLIMLTSAGVAAAFALAAFWLRHNGVDVPRIGILILSEALYVGQAFISRDHPWKWFVALLLAFGLTAITFAVSESVFSQPRSTMLFLGLTWLASGGITLYLYIRRTHLPAVEPE